MRVATADDPLVVKSISGGYLAQTAERRHARPRAGGGEDQRARHRKRNGRRWNSAGKLPST